MEERVQKIISNFGFCSRRKAEEFIRKGKVKINKRIAKIGDKADPIRDRIMVVGTILHQPRKIYLKLNKPRGVESTLKSESHKPTAISLIQKRQRIFPVGRLDVDSRGLLILTNDGELANRIMHPRYTIEKEYSVKVKGYFPDVKLDMLRKGVRLEEGITHPCHIEILQRDKLATNLIFKLHEGKKRQIRRMIKSVGYDAQDIIRTRIGPITLKGLKEGMYKELDEKELSELRKMMGLN